MLVSQAALGVPERRITKAPKLKMIVTAGIGCDHTGLAAAKARNITVAEHMINAGTRKWFKRERIRRRIYPDRAQARADVFDYIEMFYTSKRRHSSSNGLSPVQFEQQFRMKNETV